MAALNTTLVVGEDRELTLELKASDGTTALVVTGWALELRLGVSQPRLTKELEIVDGAAGRVRCVFEVDELAVVTADRGAPRYSLWRVDEGAVRLLQDGELTIREVW